MGALDIDKGQVKNIYAIAAKLGMVDRSSHEDALHELVQGLTGKTSVKNLTHSEALEVLTELRRRGAPAAPKKKRARKYDETPGGVSAAQQKKVWYLMFQLEKFDPAPEGVQLRDRLCGLITKQFKVTSLQFFAAFLWWMVVVKIRYDLLVATRESCLFSFSLGKEERQ